MADQAFYEDSEEFPVLQGRAYAGVYSGTDNQELVDWPEGEEDLDSADWENRLGGPDDTELESQQASLQVEG